MEKVHIIIVGSQLRKKTILMGFMYFSFLLRIYMQSLFNTILWLYHFVPHI
jgi:hypothetical protein